MNNKESNIYILLIDFEMLTVHLPLSLLLLLLLLLILLLLFEGPQSK